MIVSVEPTLPEKVDFLRKQEAYDGLPGEAITLETHMSWVFLTGEKAFKLKKPVRFPYLDFSTLARRETACRAELRLNRRLAAATYVDVLPLCLGAQGLSIGGEGETVEWLVVMRRLDRCFMLDRLLAAHKISALQIDRMTQILAPFYRNAERRFLPTASHIREWVHNVAENRRILLDPRFGLPPGPLRRIDRIQRQFLAERRELLAYRVRARWIVDGHGDLRPEHIWLGDPPQIIDCLEFNSRLRAVDPFDEIAFLGLECERLGAPWVGARIKRRLANALHDNIADELFSFYRCYRATLRARLAIAHLLEPDGRTPEKWPRLARDYLRIADREAAQLAWFLRRRGDRPKRGLHGADEWSPLGAGPKRG